MRHYTLSFLLSFLFLVVLLASPSFAEEVPLVGDSPAAITVTPADSAGDSVGVFLDAIELAKASLERAERERPAVTTRRGERAALLAIWLAKADIYAASAAYFAYIGDHLSAFQARKALNSALVRVYALTPGQIYKPGVVGKLTISG